MIKGHLVLIGYWISFAIIHHVMATESFKLHSIKALGAMGHIYRLVYSIVASITLFLVLEKHFRTPIVSVPVPFGVAMIAGVPGLMVGLYIVRACLNKYFLKLSGVGIFNDNYQTPALETTGLHRYCRHPLYLGTLITIWSLLILFPDVRGFISCMSVTIYVLYGTGPEETKLMKQFGNDYVRYKETTPAIFPRFFFRFK
ncbi:MAG: NnrU family protein [Flavitalea sp.]